MVKNNYKVLNVSNTTSLKYTYLPTNTTSSTCDLDDGVCIPYTTSRVMYM